MNFRPIEIQDKGIFDEFFRRYPSTISEFTFTNLFSWRNSKEHEFSIIDDHLVIRTHSFLYQPIGDSPEKVIEDILNGNPSIVFERVEGHIADKLKDKFNVEEDPDMHDYVYDINELIELKGNKFEAKRNLAKQCAAHEPEICLLDHDSIHHFFEVQRKWCDLRGCEGENLNQENEAITEALHNFDKLNLFGVCIRKGERVVSFAVGERLNDDTFVEHFEKGDTEFKGVYQFTLREFAKRIPKGFKFLNREQDLGIPGLRQAKKSYYPVKMVEKYRVTSK